MTSKDNEGQARNIKEFITPLMLVSESQAVT
jgi:hypothetical protein